jgi:hypothetical protein
MCNTMYYKFYYDIVITLNFVLCTFHALFFVFIHKCLSIMTTKEVWFGGQMIT